MDVTIGYLSPVATVATRWANEATVLAQVCIVKWLDDTFGVTWLKIDGGLCKTGIVSTMCAMEAGFAGDGEILLPDPSGVSGWNRQDLFAFVNFNKNK